MIAVYPGSFDPITTGHIDIIRRGAKLCEELVILVMQNSEKKAIFSIDERIMFIKMAIGSIQNVSVRSHEGLTIEFAQKYGIDTIIRGIRNTIDFEMETRLASVNYGFSKNIDTILLIAKPEMAHITSGVVKDLAVHGSDLVGYIPEEIREEVLSIIKHGR